ncbi:MAG: IPExxxVDY family protein [Ferruginibacter sp.]|nr:IPExxxVDY family protein [Ferruginibacter sp.]
MKLKIDTEILVEEFFEDTCLFGIVAPVKDYLFSWNINQILGFNFKINHSMEIQLRKKERNYFFSIYEYVVPGCPLIHYLYNNQNDGEYLLPEFKHLDYLWLAKGEEMKKNEINTLQQSIKLLPLVQLVTEMTNDKIKNKQYLIF